MSLCGGIHDFCPLLGAAALHVARDGDVSGF
jgi:hypothetical protein